MKVIASDVAQLKASKQEKKTNQQPEISLWLRVVKPGNERQQ